MTRARTIAIALLTLCGLALATAGTASAEPGGGRMPVVGKPITAFDRATVLDASSCDTDAARGDFCGWRHTYFTGGLYHYSGSDTNLWNDRFERKDTGVVVAKQISSVLNDGAAVARVRRRDPARRRRPFAVPAASSLRPQPRSVERHASRATAGATATRDPLNAKAPLVRGSRAVGGGAVTAIVGG